MAKKDKKVYKSPDIAKISNDITAKYSSSGVFEPKHDNVRETICGHKIDDLKKEYGSPLFVYDEKIIKDTYDSAYKAFSKGYEDVCFAWSYKTNYLSAICNIFHQKGAIAEVVSEFEYQKARKSGIEGCNIIYNGPVKSIESLKVAVKEGAKIHIDNFEEIAALEKIAKEFGVIIPVGIRVSMDTGIYPQWTKFGFNLDNGEALLALNRINKKGFLKVIGVHSHIGTFVLDHTAYYRGTCKLIDLGYLVKDIFGSFPEYLDIGGGFASKNRLKGVYHAPEVIVPDIDAYAEQVTTALNEKLKDGDKPKLFLETGRHLVDEAGYLITSVVAKKTNPYGNKAYVVDAGVNLLYTSTWYNYKVELAQKTKETAQLSVLNGCLCMNIDVIEEAIYLPNLSQGDSLILSPVGAYNITQSMQFIAYRPAVILIRESGDVALIRRAEKLEDVDTPEVLPEDLRLT